MYFHFHWCTNVCKLNLDKLEKIVWDHVQTYTNHINLQYDTENFCCYKEMAHLILSVVAIDFPDFKDCFMKGEIKIFMEQIKSLDCFKIQNQLINLSNTFNDFSQNAEHYKLTKEDKNHLPLILNILQTIIDNKSHLLTNHHSISCKKLAFIMPFTFPLKLVANREVDVKNGLVNLSCGNWFSLIEVVYEYFLKLEMKIFKNSDKLKEIIYNAEDDRIRQIIMRFTKTFFGNIKTQNNNMLKLEQVDLMSQYFPPCMANLHQIVRKSHRLSYDSRYQYTLFLKDIGLSLEENLLFWENEYKKISEGSICVHDWQGGKHRYIYQIQHLYGLLGSNEIKTSHSCQKFVQDLTSKMEGGCPFQHFTTEKLKRDIPKKLMELSDIEDLFHYKNCGMPQKACAIYLMCQKKVYGRRAIKFDEGNFIIDNVNYIVSPLQYYNIAKKFEK